MPRKIYILDTSALLSNGKRALFSFGSGEVVLPLVVIKELEAKRSDILLGFVARSVLNELENLRTANGNKSLNHDGAEINGEEKGLLRIEINHIDNSDLPDGLKNSSHDTRILAVAHNLSKDQNTGDVTLITNDLPMRLLAETVLNIKAEPFKIGGTDQGNYSGVFHVEIPVDLLDDLFKEGELHISNFIDFLPPNIGYNASLVLHTGKNSALAVVNGTKVKPLRQNISAYGAKGRNAEQKLALNHLLNPDIPIVSLGGKAGSGKTLLAIASGLEQVVESRIYNKVVVFRPLHAVGNQELGFLPGDEKEKMKPWADAIYDALEAVTTKEAIDGIVEKGDLLVLPVSHIRGRTFHKTLVIVDEAQNHERATLLTILSRLGEGSKIIFSWDASQRDNLHIGLQDGMIPIVERLKDEELFAHITMAKTERSAVADLATKVLDDLGL